MNLKQRITAVAATLALSASIAAAPIAARADERGDRNAALGLGALAAGLLLTQHNKTAGIIAAAGAAYEYSRYQHDVNDRHRWDGRYGYDDRYDGGYYGSSYDRNRYDNSGDRDRRDGGSYGYSGNDRYNGSHGSNHGDSQYSRSHRR